MKADIFNRSLSLALIASLCAVMTACRPETSQSQTSEQTPTVTSTETSESVTTETTEITETTVPDPFSEEYTYILYAGTENELTLKMNVNIDDYLTVTDNGDVFEIFRLASDLGWLEKDLYTYEDYEAAMADNPSQKTIGHSNWYTYDYGDHSSLFTITEYIEDMADFDGNQVSMVSFEFIRNDFPMPYFDDADSNPFHGKMVLNVKRHFEICNYRMGNLGTRCSRDDAIAMAYSLWSITRSPASNYALKEAFDIYADEDGDIILP